MYKHISIQIAETGVLTITINREKKLNALCFELLVELRQILEQHQNDASVKGVIITGAGQKAFAAGADISEFLQLKPDGGEDMATSGHEVMHLIESYPKPVIAAVNGYALGGGCELAMACHLRLASENARFGQPEVNLGIIPGYGGTQRLVQLIGKAKALELLMTADMIKADEALRLGLINHVVPQEELLEACEKIILKIADKAPLAIAGVIRCVNAHYNACENGFETEVKEFGKCFASNDLQEGASAFLEKRKANFKGE